MDIDEPLTEMVKYLFDKAGYLPPSQDVIKEWMKGYNCAKGNKKKEGPFRGMIFINSVVTHVYCLDDDSLFIRPDRQNRKPKYVIPRYIAIYFMVKYGNTQESAEQFYGYKSHGVASRVNEVLNNEMFTNDMIEYSMKTIEKKIINGDKFYGE